MAVAVPRTRGRLPDPPAGTAVREPEPPVAVAPVRSADIHSGAEAPHSEDYNAAPWRRWSR